MFRRLIQCGMLSATLVACGDDPTEPEAAVCTPQTASVTVTVGGTSTPVFDWEPACAVALLLVEGDGGDTWVVSSDDATWSSPEQANLLSPPMSYGTTSLPTGVTTEYGPLPLTRGETYDVIPFQVVDPTNTACADLFQNVCRLAIHEFTW
jgi:hypothetical protein